VRPGELGLEHEAHGARHTLRLQGELDLLTAPGLEAAITEIAEHSADAASEIILDLSELAFIDSTGLRAILLAKQLCESHRCELRMIRAQEQVRRLFELTGLLDMLHSSDSATGEPSRDAHEQDGHDPSGGSLAEPPL
jgi:anti-sigma B factor antagonist